MLQTWINSYITESNFPRPKHNLFASNLPKWRPEVCWGFSLTAPCDRSRSHRRSRTSDSRNIHCTSWPEIRRCRRAGERRWSALGPPWRSRLPGLIASEGEVSKKESTPGEKDALFYKRGQFVVPVSARRFTYSGACCRFGRVILCQPTQIRSCEQSDNCPANS